MKTNIQPVEWIAERLKVDDDGVPSLIGMHCKECGAIVFPKSRLCPECTSENTEAIEWRSPRGKVWSFTLVFESYGNVIGLTPPYPVAFIELEGGGYVQSVLLGLEDNLPTVGMEVSMDLLPVNQTSNTKEVVYVFRPSKQTGGSLDG